MHGRVHIFGASGSGTTTLGAALGDELGILHLDTDDYYWKATDPPFREKNPAHRRIAMIRLRTGDAKSWILSGSLCGWGDALMGEFTLAVFLHLEQPVRMQRLSKRERQRYGNRIDPDGDIYLQHQEFMRWAESYDLAKAPTRGFDLHESWMQHLSCPLLRLDSNQPIGLLVREVLEFTS